MKLLSDLQLCLSCAEPTDIFCSCKLTFVRSWLFFTKNEAGEGRSLSVIHLSMVMIEARSNKDRSVRLIHINMVSRSRDQL